MYKARYQIWITIVAISLIMMLIGSIDFSNTTYSVSSNLENDFTNRFDDFSKSGIKLKSTTSKSSDIIINKSSTEELNGYTKYSEQFYTDLIVYIQTNGYCGSSCAFYENVESSINSFSGIINLKTLLEGFEIDKTYKDIGLSEIINEHESENYIKLDSQINLFLPGKGMYYYDEVRTLVAYALNDYTYENLDNEELQLRVDNIFNKAQKYNSDKELSTRLFNNIELENRGIFIGPAYIKDAPTSDTTPDSYYHYLSFHPVKTINIKYDLYLKNTEENEYEEFFEVLTTQSFFYNTGLKNIETGFDKTYTYGLNEYK